MRDLGTQLRAYYDRISRPTDPEDVVAGKLRQTMTQEIPSTPRWWRRPAVAATAGAVLALLLMGGGATLFLGNTGNDVIATDDTTSTTAAPTTTLAPEVTTSVVETTTTMVTATTMPPTPSYLLVSFQQTPALSFEQAPTQDSFPETEPFSGDFIRSVVTGGPGLIAVGGAGDDKGTGGGWTDGAVWTSTDGLAWTRVGDPETFGGVPTAYGTDLNQVLMDVTAGPAGFVTVGWVDTGTGDTAPPIWLSPDGTTWTRVDESGFTGLDTWLTGVAANEDGYVAVGSDGIIGDAAIWTSADGDTWTRVTAGFGDAFGESSFEAVTWTGDQFIAVGHGGNEDFYFGGSPRSLGTAFVWASTDGDDWHEIELDSSSRAWVMDVVSDGETILILGVGEDRGATWVSTDGGTTFVYASFGESRNVLPWAGLIDGDRILLVGMESNPFPTYAVAWASDDGGLTWFESARLAGSDDEGEFLGAIDQTPGGFRAVVEFGDRFIVVGATGNGSSPVWIGDWKE